MGYSCSMKASYVLDALVELLTADGRVFNGLPNGGFWERGKENIDGAITGTCFKPSPTTTYDDHGIARFCLPAGSFKIDRGGKIIRFPFVSKKLREEAERKGLDRYNRIYDFNYYKPEFEELKKELFGNMPFATMDESSPKVKRYRQLLALFRPEFQTPEWQDPRFNNQVRKL